MFAVIALGLYATAVTTLASRRQELFLKRLRSTAASDQDKLVGLLLPLTVIALIQVGAIMTVFGVVGAGPARIPLLVVAVPATVSLLPGLGYAAGRQRLGRRRPLAGSLPLLLPTVGWVGLAVALAGRLFRWEPHR